MAILNKHSQTSLIFLNRFWQFYWQLMKQDCCVPLFQEMDFKSPSQGPSFSGMGNQALDIS